MELADALRTTGSVRQFTNRSVDDDVLYEVLDDARFAPSGGNRQAWRVIVVRDTATRRAVRDLYLDAWHDYVAHLLAGLVPFSPLASDEERRVAAAQRPAAIEHSRPDGFAETLDTVPVMLVVCADLAAFAATDLQLERYSMVGGASLYPFVWSILLAAHDRGLGGVMTTVATRHEVEMQKTLAIPAGFAVASVVLLGYPIKVATRLTRRLVEEFTSVDSFDGDLFLRATPD